MDLLVLAGGLGTLTFGIYQFFRTTMLVSRGLRAIGIINSERRLGRAGDAYFIHVISFETPDGGQFQFSNFGFLPRDVDSEVTVLYDSQDPGRAKIDTPFNLWSVPALYGILGSVFTIIGGLLL